MGDTSPAMSTTPSTTETNASSILTRTTTYASSLVSAPLENRYTGIFEFQSNLYRDEHTATLRWFQAISFDRNGSKEDLLSSLEPVIRLFHETRGAAAVHPKAPPGSETVNNNRKSKIKSPVRDVKLDISLGVRWTNARTLPTTLMYMDHSSFQNTLLAMATRGWQDTFTVTYKAAAGSIPAQTQQVAQNLPPRQPTMVTEAVVPDATGPPQAVNLSV